MATERTCTRLRAFADLCGYRIGGGNWQWIDPFAATSAPHVPGVYAIYLDGKLSYIGQSKDLSARLAGYRLRAQYNRFSRRVEAVTPWGRFSTIAVKVRASRRFGDWLMIERRLISRLRPPMNRA